MLVRIFMEASFYNRRIGNPRATRSWCGPRNTGRARQAVLRGILESWVRGGEGRERDTL